MDFSPADLFRSTKTGSRSSLDRVNKQLSASRGTFRQKVHIGVLVATVALVAYGAIIIWSASQFKADASFSRHLLGIGIGTVLAVLVSWLLRSAAKGDVAKSKLFLHQKEELREQQDMQVLVGHEGRTLSVLRPSGIGDFDGVRLNVVTEGEFIENGVAIRIARVEGGKIVVKAIKS